MVESFSTQPLILYGTTSAGDKQIVCTFEPGNNYFLQFLLGHVNNLYNTCFWCLVKSGQTAETAESKLSVSEGTTVLKGCISRLLYWRDASLNTLDYCIGGMHLSIHNTTVLEGCISQYITLLYWKDASHHTL